MAEWASLVHLDFPVEKILSGNCDNLLKSAESITLYNYLALGVFWNYATVFFTVLRYSLTGGPGWPWTPFGPLSPWTPFSPCKDTQAVEEAGKNRFQMVTQIPMMTNLSPSAPADPVYKTAINTLIKYFYKFCLSTKIAEQHTGSPATPCCPGRPWGPSSPCNNQLINKLQSTQLKWK